jgi:CRISPR type III-A-associated protein Csm2
LEDEEQRGRHVMQNNPRPAGGGYNQGRPPGPNYTAMTQYFDDAGKLKKEVFVDWPKQIAESLRSNKESRTSLRRFFSQLASIRFRTQMRPDEPGLVRNGIGRLHVFAQYQSGRVIKDDTKNFIHANCNAVLKDETKFDGFFELFQAVMAYLPRSS